MSWDKTKPDGALSVSIGDDHIRINNEHLEDGLAREHEFPGTFGTTGGRHKLPIAADRTAMTGIGGQVDGMIVGRQDLPLIFQRDAGAWLPKHGIIYTDSTGKAALQVDDLSNGQMLVETDAMIVYVYDTSIPDWVQVVPWRGWIVADVANDDAQSIVAANTWEDITSVGGVGGVLGVSIVIPNDGRAYEIEVHANICFATNITNQYFASRLLEDPAGAATLLHQKTGARQAGYGSAEHQLYAHEGAPVNGDTYEYGCQWATNDSGNKCVVNPTGAYIGKSTGIWAITNWSSIYARIRARQL